MLSVPHQETIDEKLQQERQSLHRLNKAIKITSFLFIIVAIAFSSYYGYIQYTQSQLSFESKATQVAKEAIRNRPRNADARVRLGVVYLQEGKYDNSIEQFKEALKVQRDHQEALVYCGIAYMKKEQYDNALKYFDKEIKYYQSTMFAKTNSYLEQAYYYGGVSHWKKKRYDKAIEYLQDALGIKATNADTYLVIGRVYMDKKEYDKAIEQFNKALEFDPKYTDVYYGLGIIYEEKGNKEEALKNYRTALKIKSDFTAAQDAIKRIEGKK